MSFVTINDFQQVIQSTDLDVVLDDNDSNITQSIFAAQSEVKSYIRDEFGDKLALKFKPEYLHQ